VNIDDKVYDKFLETLRAARKTYDDDPIDGRVNMYLVVKEFMYDLGVPPELIADPLEELGLRLIDAAYLEKRGNAPGPKPKPFKERSQLGFAVAVVSALVISGWSVADATRKVGRRFDLDPKKLRHVRDNMHRGIHDEVVVSSYLQQVRTFEKLAEDTLEEEAIAILNRGWPRKPDC
jgi:hypothetical protein